MATLAYARPSESSRHRLFAAAALIVLAGLAAGPLAPTASAHAGADALTVIAKEEGCDETYCFEVQGAPSQLTTGEQVSVTFKNPASNSLAHNLHVTTPDQADSSNEDTAAGDAFANTEDIQPGNETTIQFLVPSGSSGLYWWCDVGAHESLGMWGQAQFEGASGDGGQNGSPFVSGMAVLAALAGLALVARRR